MFHFRQISIALAGSYCISLDRIYLFSTTFFAIVGSPAVPIPILSLCTFPLFSPFLHRKKVSSLSLSGSISCVPVCVRHASLSATVRIRLCLLAYFHAYNYMNNDVHEHLHMR